jgi:predicted metalloprotease
MTFQGGGPLDTGNVSGGGGGRGRLALGGGAGLIVVIVAALFGVDPGLIGLGGDDGTSTGSTSQQTEIDQQIDSCTIEKANVDTVCRIVATTNSLDRVWSDIMPGYEPPQTKIFEGNVDTACGPATSDVGPFYCPGDQTAYFDPAFFDVLSDRLGGSDGPLAQEYVVAHEYGHHIEYLTGALDKGQRQGSAGPTSGSVRIELQADCLAGVWAFHADKGPDAMLAPLTQQQIGDVIQTAKAIGDDAIGGDSSNPEGWTHGSSEQRVRWFNVGYERGDAATCDTFAVNSL